jgi:retron-type reverse transcriptase
LNTIGKILERLALARLLPHLSISPSFSPLQSPYQKFHSTETALLKLTNDIMDAIDSGKVTILAALDMSAAFDTLDHTTLLHRLEHTFGLSGTVHTWIHSYLTNRSAFVKIDSSSSSCDTSLTGVPQGSVLGPLPFVLFISPGVDVVGLIPDI